jgi:hypothetical protein
MLPATGSSVAGATATTANPGRPRQRVDMTDDEISALSDQYIQCLTDHGMPAKSKATDRDPSRLIVPQDVVSRAKAACLSKDPLPPWELDASNPHAADFVHAVVQCLRAKGVRYVEEAPPQDGRYTYSLGGPNNDTDSVTKGLQYEGDCEKQVAGQGIGH